MLNCNDRDQLLLRQVAVLEEILKTLQRIEVKLSAAPRLGRVGRVKSALVFAWQRAGSV